jgi:hypothetical protein
MSTRTILSTVARLVIGAACAISTAACGGEMMRTGRAPVFLVVDSVTASPQGGTDAAFLISDVRKNDGSVVNDNVTVTLRSVPKNPDATVTPINSVTLTRYHVEYRRTDGRNTPGVDVPYAFDGGLSVTLTPGLTSEATFEVVRHQAKLEPPLKNLDAINESGARSLSGLGFLSTIAEITIYGRDQNGNEVSVAARLDVHFGDFADQ